MERPTHLFRSLRYGAKSWPWMAAAVLGLAGVGATTLAGPQFLRIAVDDGIAKGDPQGVVVATAGLLIVAALRGLSSFLQGYGAERASQGLAFELRNALFTHIQRLSFSYYDSAQTGQLLTRVTSDVEQVRTFLGQGLVQLIGSQVMLIGTIVILFITNALLAAVALLPIPFVLWSVTSFTRVIGPRFGQIQQLVGTLNSLLQQNLAGVRVVRAFAQQGAEQRRFAADSSRLLDLGLDINRRFAANFPTVFFLASAGGAAVALVGGWQVIDGSLTAGELIAFTSYLGFLLMPILGFGFLAFGLARAQPSARRVFEVLDAPIDVREVEGAFQLGALRGEIEFDRVTFRYPGDERPVLNDVSFHVQPGQTVAILGATGSGKSTVVSLIPRFYDPSFGAVRIDGRDVRLVRLADLRSQIGIVM
jgi:ATP-binding cassette subfamily B protein